MNVDTKSAFKHADTVQIGVHLYCNFAEAFNLLNLIMALCLADLVSKIRKIKTHLLANMAQFPE